ncbi:MAG: hypothetical protein RL377_367 [Bacteroidota bacterium]|jgi:glycosyltransferase involved in cell wall biosynthesis
MVLNPLISVLLPVYNAEQYLKQSLESILGQTYTNLEIIIINDGSSDQSKEIINSYQDARIVYIEQPHNKGLIACLNEGIQIAKGDYIIRMDADDIAFNNRIEKQINFLASNPSIAVVGSNAIFIEDNVNAPIANWDLDLKIKTSQEIRKTLLWENCLIHPSICMRSSIAKSFYYDKDQKNYEDFDLWLRIIAKNLNIAKINEPLLYYRVQPNSITQTAIRKHNFYFQKGVVKLRFVLKNLKQLHFNAFIGGVLITSFADLIMSIGKSLKQLVK